MLPQKIQKGYTLRYWTYLEGLKKGMQSFVPLINIVKYESKNINIVKNY